MAVSRKTRDTTAYYLNLLSSILPMIGGVYGFVDNIGKSNRDRAAYDEFIAKNQTQPGIRQGPERIPMPDIGGMEPAPVSRETMPQPLPVGPGGATPGLAPAVGPAAPVSMADVPAAAPMRMLPQQRASVPDVMYDQGGKMQELTAEDMAQLFGSLSGADSRQWKQAEMLYSGQQTDRARAEREEAQTKAELSTRRREMREDRQYERETASDAEARIANRLKLYGQMGMQPNPELGAAGIEKLYRSWGDPNAEPVMEVDGKPVFVPADDYMPGSVQYVTGTDGKMAISWLTKKGEHKMQPVPDMNYKAGTKPKPASGKAKKPAKQNLDSLIDG